MARRQNAWTADRDEVTVGAWGRLRMELGALVAPVVHVAREGRRSLSERLIELGDMALDTLMTPVGRVLTATVSLTIAWALIR